MVGSYTAFEVEAQRRREVLEDSMRDARGVRSILDAPRHDPCRPDQGSVGRSLADLASGLRSRTGQRA